MQFTATAAAVAAPLKNGSNGIESAVPLTHAMREMWLATQLGETEANLGYNEVIELRFDGQVDDAALESALNVLTQRHAALRGRFAPDGSRFLLPTHEPVALHRSEVRSESELDTIRRRQVTEPFDLIRGPLFRLELVRLDASRAHLFVRAHHLVCDGWSMVLVLTELGKAYRAISSGASVALPPAEDYADAVGYQVAYEGSDDAEKTVQWWVERLKDAPEEIELPLDRSRPSGRTYDSERRDLRIDGVLAERLRGLAKTNNCAFLTALQAAFAALIHRLTGRDDIVLGMPTAGQPAMGRANLVGNWLHTLPLRIQLDRSRSFNELLAEHRALGLQVLDHQRVTFGHLLDRLDRPTGILRVPLIPVTLNLDPPMPPLDFGGCKVSWSKVARRYDAFEIFLNVVDHGDELELQCNYATQLFEAATVDRWLETFRVLVQQVVDHPDQPLESLEILTDDDRRVLRSLHETTAPHDGDQTALHRFEAQVRLRPDAVALRFRDVDLTYAALDQRAAVIAGQLREAGVERQARVAIHLPRGPDLVASLLAVWRLGAAYVPVDPSHPEARKQLIIDGAEPTCVVSEHEGFGAPVVRPVDATGAAGAGAEAATRYPAGEDLAYVIFTSGSTGRPKGVAIEHGGVSNFIEAMVENLEVTAADRLFAVTTTSFDISVLELFVPLSTGATVVLADDEDSKDPARIRQWLEAGGISLFQATPATYQMLVDSDWQRCPGLRAVCGGEALPPTLADQILARVDRLTNAYGPTECTVWATLKDIEKGQPITLGRPFRNVTAHVLTPYGQPAPIGVDGELWLGGVQLARCYLGRPELTKERFVPTERGRLYRTGDVARILPSGEIAFVGRADFQVKIRGYRIELEDIENNLRAIDGVEEAVVVAHRAGSDAMLVGFMRSNKPLSDAAIRAQLKTKLPGYMVPARLQQVPAMPLSPSGKVDRKALMATLSEAETAAAPARRAVDDEDVAIRTMAKLWSDVLGHDNVTADDDFFELGGNSLAAVRLIAEIDRAYGQRLPVSAMLTGGTIRSIAGMLKSVAPAMPAPPAPDQPGARVEPAAITAGGMYDFRASDAAQVRHRVFFIHDADGEIIPYRALSRVLPASIAIVGVEPESAPGMPTVHATIETMAESYAARILEASSSGPYWVGGLCAGGVISFEIIRCLERWGRRVGGLIVLDAANTLAPVVAHNSVRRVSRMQQAFQETQGTMLSRLVQTAQIVRTRGQRALTYEFEHRLLSFAEGVRYRLLLRHLKRGDPLPSYLQHIPIRTIYDKAELRYVPSGTINCPILLVRATEGDGADLPVRDTVADEYFGWKKLTTNEIYVMDAPGGHSTMLQEPNVQHVGAFLRTQMGEEASK